MALSSPLDQQIVQTQNSNLLEIGAVKYYFETLRPALVFFNQKYRTDRELNRTIVEVLNHADGAVYEKRFNDLEDACANLLAGINDKNYMTIGPMRYGSDEEKKAVQDLNEKFNDLSLIIKYEHAPEQKKPEIRERLNYRPPNGGYPGINLDDLSNRGPKPNKERIPNRESPKFAY